MRLVSHLLSSIACVVAAGLAQAQVDDSARRSALAGERESEQSRYAAAARACEAQFAVTACLDKAKRERRRALDRLDSEQAKLDQAVRQRRAAERRARIDEKQRVAAQRTIVPPAADSTKAAQRAGSAAARTASAPTRRVRNPDGRALDAAAAASARQSAAAQRRREALAHAEAAHRRQAERAAHRAPAAGLPAASAASASRLR